MSRLTCTCKWGRSHGCLPLTQRHRCCFRFSTLEGAIMRGLKHCLSLLILTTLLFSLGASPARSATGPSTFCHVTDGTFTTCADGHAEWSDITPVFFPSSNTYLYADQANLTTPGATPDTFMLMYDECSQTSPLSPDQYVLVSFNTVETEGGVEALNHY